MTPQRRRLTRRPDFHPAVEQLTRDSTTPP
jgi:hypothetical protein